jgi:hypothetical protein
MPHWTVLATLMVCTYLYLISQSIKLPLPPPAPEPHLSTTQQLFKQWREQQVFNQVTHRQQTRAVLPSHQILVNQQPEQQPANDDSDGGIYSETLRVTVPVAKPATITTKQPIAITGQNDRHHQAIVYDDTWLLEYRKRHHEIMSSPGKRRMVVFSCAGGCGGLGDRIIGMTNALILAVLTDRAFMIQESNSFVCVRCPALHCSHVGIRMGGALIDVLRAVSIVGLDRCAWHGCKVQSVSGAQRATTCSTNEPVGSGVAGHT